VVAVHKEAIESVVAAGTEVATQTVEKAVALTKENVDAAVKVGSTAFKGYEDVLQFNKENVEALVASGNILARGIQDLSKSLVALTQESLEETVSVSKALLAAKTLKEVIDLSSSLAKTNFDKLVSEGTRLSSLSTKLAEDTLAPINSRVDAAVERLVKIAA